jgi:hypothetical protein
MFSVIYIICVLTSFLCLHFFVSHTRTPIASCHFVTQGHSHKDWEINNNISEYQNATDFQIYGKNDRLEVNWETRIVVILLALEQGLLIAKDYIKFYRFETLKL